MSSSNKPCHLKCELDVLSVRNLDPEYFPGLFIRCYVSVGGGRCVRVDSREIPSSCCSPCQSPLAVIETQGDAAHMSKLLEEHGVVFDLRRRKRKVAASLLPLFSRSKLVGRASVAWKEADMSTERWITVDTGRRVPGDQKPPAMLVGMKIRLSEKPERAGRRAPHWEQCRCRHCEWNLEEEDMFALANTIPAAC